MAQTVLGGSAGTVHRQGHRNSSLHVETDLRGLNDSRSHSCSTLTRAADSGNPRQPAHFVVSHRQVPTIKKIPKTVEILQAKFIHVEMKDESL